MAMDWEKIGQQISQFFQDNIWNIIEFFATLVIGLIVIKIIMMVLKRIFKKKGFDAVASRFVLAIIRFFLWLIFILLLLAEIGVPLTGITTSLSAAILAIGMALKEFLSNVASGIILVGSRKYKTGDYIIVGGVEGSIVDVNFLFTTLKTPNSTQITLPNSTMVNSSVTNLGAYPVRRVTFDFGVAYESDTALVVKTVLDVLHSNGKILLDPAPTCRLKTLGESSINYFVTCFCDNADYWDVYYYVMERVYDEFKRVGISIPFKQIEMRERKEPVVYPVQYESLPERVEKERPQGKEGFSIEKWEDASLVEVLAQKRKKPKKPKKKKPKKKTDDKKEE